MITHPASLRRTVRFCVLVAITVLSKAEVYPAEAARPSTLPPARRTPALGEVLAAQTDLWGEAALQQPNGPSYEFFAGVLPPLRYVNARFRHYPIVLSAPRASCKARLASNGSALNPKAGLGTWSDAGFPVRFLVGVGRGPFGEDLDRLDGPRYAEGYLPIVGMSYRDGPAVYRQEAFASVMPPWVASGTVFVQFSLAEGQAGVVAAVVDTSTPLIMAHGALRDEKGRVYAYLGANWQWDGESRTLRAPLAPGQSAILAVLRQPAAGLQAASLNEAEYHRQRAACAAHWQSLLERGARLEVPEAVVDRAWRALIVGTLMIARGDQMNYSVDNAYAQMYAEECSSPIHALLMFGLADEARPMIGPILTFQRQPALKYHNAAFKLQLLNRYYWLTRDEAYIRGARAHWQAEVDAILAGRERQSGLLPKERYCGDISNPVYSLSVNANCWRGLRDLAAVRAELNEPDPNLVQTVRQYRQAILSAVSQSEFRDTQPPFIPLALFGAEKPYPSLTASMLGSYWNLMSNYLLRSGVFATQPEKARWIARYVQEHGGLCMGMLRFDQHSGLFANVRAVDELYTLGYVMYLLETDDVDRALVTFYGKLARGLTRDTFIGGEGTGLEPLDRHGRPMYLPPNCSGNALFLWMLRNLLVQDWDADDDGRPDTLRLLFATPRAWLGDGKAIRAHDLPTAFGKISIDAESHLARGEVLVRVAGPQRTPKSTLLRVRLPDGWEAVSARSGEQRLTVDARGTVDLSGRPGTVRFSVRRRE